MIPLVLLICNMRIEHSALPSQWNSANFSDGKDIPRIDSQSSAFEWPVGTISSQIWVDKLSYLPYKWPDGRPLLGHRYGYKGVIPRPLAESLAHVLFVVPLAVNAQTCLIVVCWQ